MTTALTLDFSSLARQLAHPGTLKRIRNKSIQALHEYFIIRAAASPAWALNPPPEEVAYAEWLYPGTYSLIDLQERFAPRFHDNPRTADPKFQIIGATVIESFSSMLKALLLLEEQEELVAEAEANGLSIDDLHQEALSELGSAPCQDMVRELKQFKITLEGVDIRAAGERRVLSQVVLMQEELHTQRSKHHNAERYAHLLKQWQVTSGDLHNALIVAGSPLSFELATWLQSIPLSDAAIFLDTHHSSAKVAMGHMLPAEVCEAISAALPQNAAAPHPELYRKVSALLKDILNIKGLRRVTISTDEAKFIRVDIDPCNRVGVQERQLPFFIRYLLTGLASHAGVMVRAYQNEKVNIFDPVKGVFVEHTLKFLYGVLLEHGNVFGLNEAQVYDHIRRADDGTPVAVEPSVRAKSWPAIVQPTEGSAKA